MGENSVNTRHLLYEPKLTFRFSVPAANEKFSVTPGGNEVGKQQRQPSASDLLTGLTHLYPRVGHQAAFQ